MSVAFGQIDQLDSQLDAQIEALNTSALGCAAFTAPDATAWSGFYGAWKALHKQWSNNEFIAKLNPFISGPVIVLLFTNDIYTQMQSYLAQLPQWQTKIHGVCPSYTLPPSIIVPPPPNPNELSPTDKLIEAARVVGGAAISIGAGYAMFKIAQLVGDIRSSVKA